MYCLNKKHVRNIIKEDTFSGLRLGRVLGGGGRSWTNVELNLPPVETPRSRENNVFGTGLQVSGTNPYETGMIVSDTLRYF